MKKNSTFFTEDENLISILEKNLPNISKDFNKIPTGWTNIVIEFKSNNEDYIARFPRNDFFSKAIEKDCLCCNFLKGKIDFLTPDMKIYYDKGRPFSVHKKIKGIALSKRIDNLSKEKINKIAKDIAKFFSQIHNIDIKTLPDEFRSYISHFVRTLPKIEDGFDYTLYDNLQCDEKSTENVFIHGDLNDGNIIVDENDNIIAIIDFAFCGISEPHFDLCRISSRIDKDFLDKIIDEYKKASKRNINKEKIKERSDLWKYIDSQYIKYMKVYNPEIAIPDLV